MRSKMTIHLPASPNSLGDEGEFSTNEEIKLKNTNNVTPKHPILLL